MSRQRLHKILARAGVASRRRAEELVWSGRVTVNGLPVTEPGSSADPEKDRICVDGTVVQVPGDRVVLMLHKPRGVVTTMRDPQGRPTVRDLLGDLPRRVFPVGRLDVESEGLLLMTDDGDLALRIQHPRYGMVKTYDVQVRGLKRPSDLDVLMQGTEVDGENVVPLSVEALSGDFGSAWIRIRVGEGRKRQVRRMCDQVGLRVLRLKRVAIGGLLLGKLPAGRFRVLLAKDVRKLFSEENPDPVPAARQRSRPRDKKTAR